MARTRFARLVGVFLSAKPPKKQILFKIADFYNRLLYFYQYNTLRAFFQLLCGRKTSFILNFYRHFEQFITLVKQKHHSPVRLNITCGAEYKKALLKKCFLWGG